MTTDLNEKQVWTGESPEGFAYEIAFWGKGTMCDGAGMWNYYVTIREAQLTPENWAKVWLPVQDSYTRSDGYADPSYREYDSILEVGNFHGGITFYEKKAQVDGTRRQVKVGCDYGHLWDAEAGYPYSLTSVQRDALDTCSRLAKALNPLARCPYSGRYFDPRFDVAPDAVGYRGKRLSPGGMGSRSAYDFRERMRQNPELFAAAE